MCNNPQKICLILTVTGILIFGNIAKASHSAPITGAASYYSTECCKYNPDLACPMASGRSLYAAEAAGESFAAGWRWKLGTKLRVTNLANKKSTLVIIQDRGPAKRLHRIIDLSKKSFKEIADTRSGVIRVTVEEIP